MLPAGRKPVERLLRGLCWVRFPARPLSYTIMAPQEALARAVRVPVRIRALVLLPMTRDPVDGASFQGESSQKGQRVFHGRAALERPMRERALLGSDRIRSRLSHNRTFEALYTHSGKTVSPAITMDYARCCFGSLAAMPS